MYFGMATISALQRMAVQTPGRSGRHGCARRVFNREGDFRHQRGQVINCERKSGQPVGRNRCIMRLRKIGFRVAHCKKNQTSALGKEKLAWLQQHDQDCGALYGVLPLCIGMPIVATDHLDRDRGLLRGCPGTVVGWKLAEAQHGDTDNKGHIWNNLPVCIFSF